METHAVERTNVDAKPVTARSIVSIWQWAQTPGCYGCTAIVRQGESYREMEVIIELGGKA